MEKPNICPICGGTGYIITMNENMQATKTVCECSIDLSIVKEVVGNNPNGQLLFD